jgi:hypothetical protein
MFVNRADLGASSLCLEKTKLPSVSTLDTIEVKCAARVLPFHHFPDWTANANANANVHVLDSSSLATPSPAFDSTLPNLRTLCLQPLSTDAPLRIRRQTVYQDHIEAWKTTIHDHGKSTMPSLCTTPVCRTDTYSAETRSNGTPSGRQEHAERTAEQGK